MIISQQDWQVKYTYQIPLCNYVREDATIAIESPPSRTDLKSTQFDSLSIP